MAQSTQIKGPRAHQPTSQATRPHYRATERRAVAAPRLHPAGRDRTDPACQRASGRTGRLRDAACEWSGRPVATGLGRIKWRAAEQTAVGEGDGRGWRRGMCVIPGICVWLPARAQWGRERLCAKNRRGQPDDGHLRCSIELDAISSGGTAARVPVSQHLSSGVFASLLTT